MRFLGLIECDDDDADGSSLDSGDSGGVSDGISDGVSLSELEGSSMTDTPKIQKGA